MTWAGGNAAGDLLCKRFNEVLEVVAFVKGRIPNVVVAMACLKPRPPKKSRLKMVEDSMEVVKDLGTEVSANVGLVVSPNLNEIQEDED